MDRTFNYRGYAITVCVEADFTLRPHGRSCEDVGYVPVIRIADMPEVTDETSRIRLGDAGGNPFSSEADAMFTGCSAARRIVDDLCTVIDEEDPESRH